MPGIPSWKMTFRRGKGMAKKPSRIKMDLGGFVPHELRQNHPKTQLGKDFRDLRWCSLWTLVWCHVGFRMLRHPYLGLSQLNMVPLAIPRQTLAYGPGGSIDKPLAATGILGWAEWLREPPLFSPMKIWTHNTANQKALALIVLLVIIHTWAIEGAR